MCGMSVGVFEMNNVMDWENRSLLQEMEMTTCITEQHMYIEV